MEEVSKKARIAGWVLTLLPVPLLLMSAGFKFVMPAEAAKNTEAMGWSVALAPKLGVVELIITLLFLIPRTAVLGAVLLTGYLGGATAAHVRVGQPFVIPVLLGVIAWLGLYLRDRRVRDLLPLRRV